VDSDAGAAVSIGKVSGISRRGGSPYWWIEYSGPQPDGSWGRIRESAKTTNLEKARRLLEDRRRAVANHREGIRKFQGPAQERITVGELLDNLEKHYEARKLKSLRPTRAHGVHLRSAFGFVRAARITRVAIDGYIADRRAAGAAEATIDRETELLHRALALGQEDGFVSFVPRVSRLVKKGENARQGFLERDDFDKLVAALPNQLLRDIAMWGYGTGMRKNEVLSLTWEGYDRETLTIRLAARDAKNSEGRTIPLAGWPELARVIDSRLADRRPGCALVFHHDGHRVGDFYWTWVRATVRAGVGKVLFHDLRRTAVRNMMKAGIDRTVAKRISGHKTDSIFERYQIIDEGDLAEAIGKRAVYEAGLPRTQPRLS
jgi:integrase